MARQTVCQSWYPRLEPLGILEPAIAHLSANPSPRTAEALGVLEQRLAATSGQKR